jgi:hypothetical protein
MYQMHMAETFRGGYKYSAQSRLLEMYLSFETREKLRARLLAHPVHLVDQLVPLPRAALQ